MIASDQSTMDPAEYQAAVRQLAGVLTPHMKSAVDETKVRQIVDKAVAEARLPRPFDITINGEDVIRVDGAHCQFEQVMELVKEGRKNVMLVGPAGTGKTTLGKHVAKALQRQFKFISLSAGVTEAHLFGRMLPKSDGTWGYVESAFISVYRNGGVFLFDEVDAADPNVMVSVNAALANGELANPITGEIVERHADCLIVAAANTYGLGGDAMYVGRNQLDAATLDRFVLAVAHIGYDEELERQLSACLPEETQTRLLAWVRSLRDAITSKRLRRVASTRLVVHARDALMVEGTDLEAVKARFFVSWSTDEKAKVQA